MKIRPTEGTFFFGLILSYVNTSATSGPIRLLRTLFGLICSHNQGLVRLSANDLRTVATLAGGGNKPFQDVFCGTDDMIPGIQTGGLPTPRVFGWDRVIHSTTSVYDGLVEPSTFWDGRRV